MHLNGQRALLKRVWEKNKKERKRGPLLYVMKRIPLPRKRRLSLNMYICIVERKYNLKVCVCVCALINDISGWTALKVLKGK